MHNINPHEFEPQYRQIGMRAKRRLQRRLDRFGQSLYEWLTAALNWPEENWQADLANFVAHSRMTGIELSAESLAEIRGLVEARVNGTGVFGEEAFSDVSPEPIRHLSEVRAKVTGPIAEQMSAKHERNTNAVQLAAALIAPDPDTDATVDLSEGPKEEVAGPGPETSSSFNEKVQTLLDLLDEDVADVWKQFQGVVRVRDGNWLQFSYYTERNKKQLVIVVSPHFTAQDTATAIITEAYKSSWLSAFTNPIHSELRDKKLLTDEEIAKRFAEIRTEAFKEAAATAAFFAEAYYGSIASLTPGGDLIVTIDDIDRNGVNWNHLLSSLPLLAIFRKTIKRLVLMLPGGKAIELPGQLLEKLSSLSENRRNKLISRAKTAKSKEEALSILKREIAATARGGQVHHLISGKVYNALQKHKVLKGKYSYRDKRFEVIAVSEEAHRGWAEWHRKLDDEVAIWIGRNQSATQSEFENWLRWRYAQPDLKWRFAIGTQ